MWKPSLTFEYAFPPLSSCNENRKSVKFRDGTVRHTERHRCLSQHTTSPFMSNTSSWPKTFIWAPSSSQTRQDLKPNLALMRINWRTHLTFLTETRHTQGSRTPVLGLALILHTKENLFLQRTAFWWTSSLWAREQRSRAVISDTRSSHRSRLNADEMLMLVVISTLY